MAQFLIYAHEAEFSTSGGGFRCMAYKPFDPRLYVGEFEAAKVTEVVAEQERVADVLKAMRPGQSFFVTAALRSGRAPNGFKSLRPLEYDAELVAMIDDSVGALVAARKLDPEKANPVPDPVIDGALYEVVGLPGGAVHTFAPGQVFPALEVRGFPHKGFSKSRALRQELQGRPEFTGLCGPMWGGNAPDGRPIVRYETWPVYNAMCD